MNYIERRRAGLADMPRERLVNMIIDRELNDFVSHYADYAENDARPDPGRDKRVPYIGWYWRSVRFAEGVYRIGSAGELIGFMENNKWGYPERDLTADESEQVTEIVCRAYELSREGGNAADIFKNTTDELEKLHPLLQSFPVEVEGFWIHGPQGRVAFDETSEGADRLVDALSTAGGVRYWKEEA